MYFCMVSVCMAWGTDRICINLDTLFDAYLDNGFGVMFF